MRSMPVKLAFQIFNIKIDTQTLKEYFINYAYMFTTKDKLV